MASKKTQAEVQRKLEIANQKLTDALLLIKEVQRDEDSQFDFCTTPSISPLVSNVKNKAEQISRLWYQEGA